MLLLEKECYKMAPLIEENLQAVDNRLAMLNAVDDKISAAIELFRTLSNQDALKYSAGENYSHSTVHFPQPQISQPSSTMAYSNIQAVPSQVYVPASSVVQYAKTVSEENNKSVFSAQTPILHQSQMQTPQNCIPVSSVQVTEASHSIPTSDNSTKPSSNQNIPASAVLNPTNPLGGYYMPSGMPYQMPLPNFQPQGYMPPGSTFPNFMPIPYPVPPVGPYFPFPYCYVNSSTPSAQSTACTGSVPFTQFSENSHTSSNSAVSTEETASSSALQASNYSSDLQQLLVTSNAND
ncbi:hypothetical protein X975_25650, partial [Stegodyphus mimosarum]